MDTAHPFPICCRSDYPLGGSLTLLCQERGQGQPEYHNPSPSFMGLAPRLQGNGLFPPHWPWEQWLIHNLHMLLSDSALSGRLQKMTVVLPLAHSCHCDMTLKLFPSRGRISPSLGSGLSLWFDLCLALTTRMWQNWYIASSKPSLACIHYLFRNPCLCHVTSLSQPTGR